MDNKDGICSKELASFSNFKEYCTPGPNEEILTNHFTQYKKVCWYSSPLEQLKSTPDGDTLTYDANMNHHFLLYTYLIFKTIEVTVRPEYRNKVRVKMTHNLGHNMIKNAELIFRDMPIQSFDNFYLDATAQYNMAEGAGKREAYEAGLGNIQYLEQWSHYLPEIDLGFLQPWFYAAESHSAFPLFRAAKNKDQLQHRYDFRLHIKDLLCVQLLDENDNWVNLSDIYPKDTTDYAEALKKYLQCKKDKLENPKLMGRYVDTTNGFINAILTKPAIYYIRTMDAITGETVELGTTSKIDLSSTSPSVALYWMAENAQSSDWNNHSNYSTNAENSLDGQDPITTTTLTYEGRKVFSDLSSLHFNIISSQKHFPSCPNEIGYHAYSFCDNLSNLAADVGPVFNNLSAALSIKIDRSLHIDKYNKYEEGGDQQEHNSSIDRILMEQKAADNSKFNIRVYSTIIRRLSFDPDSDNPDTLNGYNITYT